MIARMILVAAAIATPLVMAAGPSRAQDDPGLLPPAIIGIIDSQFILVNSEASQGIRTQIQLIRDLYSAEITQLENELRAQEQELSRQRAILAPEAFDERLRIFENEVDRVQRLVAARNDQMDRAFNEAMGQVRDALLRVVIEAAELRGFNIILEQADILWTVRTLDITDGVMARLNEILPNVEVPIPDD